MAFKKKTDMDGNVHIYKARLVAKGFTQTYGVDYKETFSRVVVDIKAIRILIAIAAFYDYEIWQMDVKTTFLNGYLDKDIYMAKIQASNVCDNAHSTLWWPFISYAMIPYLNGSMVEFDALILAKIQASNVCDNAHSTCGGPFISGVMLKFVPLMMQFIKLV
ncbi:retrotransposon protein, putative, ty1-copia subclass [Tanacetum coccineum]